MIAGWAVGVVAVRRQVTVVAAMAAVTAGAGVASVELLPVVDDNHDVIRVCEVQERRRVGRWLRRRESAHSRSIAFPESEFHPSGRSGPRRDTFSGPRRGTNERGLLPPTS